MRVFAPQRPIHCPGCAAGSAARPFRSIATRFRSWRWTRGWSRWLTTWPIGSGSTAASRPRTSDLFARTLAFAIVGSLVCFAVGRHVPALDALLVAARVPQDRRGRRARRPRAGRLCRGRPAAADLDRPTGFVSLSVPTGVLVLFGLLTGAFLTGTRYLVHFVYERPLQRLPRAPQRALGADRRRRRRRPPAAARADARTRSSATARSASSTTTRARRACASTRPRCSARRTSSPEVLEDVEPDEVLIAIPSAPGTLRGARRAAPAASAACRCARCRPSSSCCRPAAASRASCARCASRTCSAATRADGDRVRRRLPDRPLRAGHRRGRLDRLRALPPDRAREPEPARAASTTARRTCSRSSASSSDERHVLTPVSVLADCKDDERMREVFAEHRPEVVFHAAAYKHVALMEDNPIEAVRNNALATRTLTAIAGEYGVARVRARLDRQGGRSRDGHGRVQGARRVGRRGRRRALSRTRRSAPCASATCSAPPARWCRSSAARSRPAAR